MVRRSQLPNGVRVLSEEIPGMLSVSVGLWVENGSRFEPAELNGISHFLEHLLFKGTARRTAAQIAEEIDGVGGVINAFTGKEHTCYYVRVLGEHFALAGDVLADLFLRSVFDPEEIERERTVVLQEIFQEEDTPDDYIHDLFSLKYWPGHPLGFPVCGRSETVRGLTRADVLDFFSAHYRPDRLIVVAAGDIEHERFLQWAEREFSSLEGTSAPIDGSAPIEQNGLFALDKPLEQVHLCLGTSGVAQGAPERFAAYLLNTALGGGMSSRLFQEVRERRGLAYAVYSFLSSYRDIGYLGIYVGTSPKTAEKVVRIILAELRKLVREGLRPDELSRVKNQLKGSMLLGLETSDSRMARLAKNEIHFGRHIPVEETAAAIDATTNEEILALANRMIRRETMAIALLGDIEAHRVDENVLADF